MKIYIEKQDKHIEIAGAKDGNDLLKQLELSSSSSILVRNGEIILAEEPLSKDDSIEILSVVSGG